MSFPLQDDTDLYIQDYINYSFVCNGKAKNDVVLGDYGPFCLRLPFQFFHCIIHHTLVFRGVNLGATFLSAHYSCADHIGDFPDIVH